MSLLRRRMMVVKKTNQGGGDSGDGNDFGIQFPLYLEFDYCEDKWGGKKYCERAADDLSLKLYSICVDVVNEYGCETGTVMFVSEQELDMLGIKIYIEGEKVICIFKDSSLIVLETNGEHTNTILESDGLMVLEGF